MDRDAVERLLDAVLSSPEFAGSPKMRELLRYLVEAMLEGRGDQLKGYTIGVDVFERSPSFDPASDSIVRVQVSRLRELLEKHYRGSGAGAAFRLHLPKGGYLVAIDAAPAAEATAARPPRRRLPLLEAAWTRLSASGRRIAVITTFASLLLVIASIQVLLGPLSPGAEAPVPADGVTLAVLPFTDLTDGASQGAFAEGLTDALTTALSRIGSVSLSSRTAASQYRGAVDPAEVSAGLGVRYFIEGSVQRTADRMRVNVQLIDADANTHIWARDYEEDARDAFAVQDAVVASVAGEMRQRLFNAVRSDLEAHPPSRPSAWELYLQSTWTPGGGESSLAWEHERVALAERALALDPDFAPAHATLAAKLSFLAMVDADWDTPERRAEATEHARRALDLTPSDPDVVFNVTRYAWHTGAWDEAIRGARRTLDLDPHHSMARYFDVALPYVCSPAPQPVIDELIAFDARLAPDDPVRWVSLFGVSFLELVRGGYEDAAEYGQRAEQLYATPDSVFVLAAALHQLGRTGEARRLMAELTPNWPNSDARHIADAALARRCGEEAMNGPAGTASYALIDALEASPTP